MESIPENPSKATRVVVATTVALAFISFWRAAAIVLSDLASTMFYVGGIAEKSIGPSAPWVVIAVMLFSYAVRSIYLESCGMFVRGGVYVVVRQSLGPFVAKLSVSALVVDYILTGPISSVSAGQYLGRLLNELMQITHQTGRVDPNFFAMGFGLLVTAYFWWSNVKGIHESSGKALRIMQITTVMVVILLIWCPLSLLFQKEVHLPPLPTQANLNAHFTSDSLGWLQGTFWPTLAGVGILIAFGHSLLAMSGFETLAQVYREIASPKMKNLKLTANIVCTYALISTGLVSLFAVMIIPDNVRPQYYDNLIGGLSMSLVGPPLLKLGFHIFVVIVGVLILSGAVNTSLIGANGILNRVAEDGVLLNWFRRPHRKFGTTSRIVNLVVLLQVGTILFSRGDVFLLGEAYAFGVVWSFTLKGIGVLALRFQRHDQEYKTPLNLRIGKFELPVGLAATTLMLFLVAIANLFTKKLATIYGISFTLVLMVLFVASEHWNRRKVRKGTQALEEFNLVLHQDSTAPQIAVRPGGVLVAVRNYVRLTPLLKVLRKTNLRRHDIVVMTVRNLDAGVGEYDLASDQIFTDYEQELFTHVVEVAEKEGKPVELLVVPSAEPFRAMVRTATDLKVSRLVVGLSPTMKAEELAQHIGLAWEGLPEPKQSFSLEIVDADGGSRFVDLGPHPPRLWPEDLDLLHNMWLRLTGAAGIGSSLHHRDIVGFALRRLESELNTEEKEKVLAELRREISS